MYKDVFKYVQHTVQVNTNDLLVLARKDLHPELQQSQRTQSNSVVMHLSVDYQHIVVSLNASFILPLCNIIHFET